mmetsp:Transcript_6025/g.13218  ORF Transcript_6025/g.13218 Transcript_6025/m.13218 type:complete len:222 (+) Transcript_6025:1413-2078(+)
MNLPNWISRRGCSIPTSTPGRVRETATSPRTSDGNTSFPTPPIAATNTFRPTGRIVSRHPSPHRPRRPRRVRNGIPTTPTTAARTTAIPVRSRPTFSIRTRTVVNSIISTPPSVCVRDLAWCTIRITIPIPVEMTESNLRSNRICSIHLKNVVCSIGSIMGCVLRGDRRSRRSRLLRRRVGRGWRTSFIPIIPIMYAIAMEGNPNSRSTFSPVTKAAANSP